MPDRYRKKPVEITAVQWTGTNADEVREFMGSDEFVVNRRGGGPPAVRLVTVHGDTAWARVGDWIIPEAEPGRFYPCKPDIFAATYDPAPDDVDVRWGSSVLTEDTPNPDDTDEIIPAGVFLTCHGDDLEDVRAVLRVEHAVAEDGAEVSRPLAAKLAALLNQQHVEPLPGETE